MKRARQMLVASAVAGVALFSQPGVAIAAPGPPSAPEWWFDTWGVPALWAAGARGGDITIAEIDTGVNSAITQIAGNLVPGKDFGAAGGNGYVDHETQDFGHGTAMASLMVATKGAQGVTGLAPDASVMPIALPIDGTDDAAGYGSDHLPDAIRWAADNGGKIISMSLGGERDPGEDSVPCPSDEQDAITYAISKGLIVVAASGNSGDEGSPVEDPGVCLGVVSVGSVDQNNAVADFSSRHPYLTMTAPGVAIPTLGKVPGQVYKGQGTSQSTAIVSAALALIWSKFPSLSGRQIVSRALSGLDHASATRDPGYGFGIINPATAINSGNENAANPVYDGIAPYVALLAEKTAPSDVKVPAASRSTAIPGRVTVGPAPSVWSPSLLASLGAAVAGLVLLILLGVGVLRSRRRRRRLAATQAAQLSGAGFGGLPATGYPPGGSGHVPPTGGYLVGSYAPGPPPTGPPSGWPQSGWPQSGWSQSAWPAAGAAPALDQPALDQPALDAPALDAPALDLPRGVLPADAAKSALEHPDQAGTAPDFPPAGDGDGPWQDVR